MAHSVARDCVASGIFAFPFESAARLWYNHFIAVVNHCQLETAVI
jgi:hypothetical protein